MGWDKFDFFFLKNKEEASEMTKMGEREKTKKKKKKIGFLPMTMFSFLN